jgi:predicted Fe-Mo cluster-binding NifX family protein
MDKKIAIPIDSSGRLDEHFGHCEFFSLIKVKNGTIISEEQIVPPPHEPGLLPKWLSEKGVSDIIAGGMGQRAIQLFNHFGVNAFVGAPKLSAQELVKGFLEESLNFSANYCDH